MFNPEYTEQFFYVILASIAAALVIEAALYQVFHSKSWVKLEELIDKKMGTDAFDLKPFISVLIAFGIVNTFNFDIFSVIFSKDQTSTLTILMTAFFLSGGSSRIYKVWSQFKAFQKKGSSANEK